MMFFGFLLYDNYSGYCSGTNSYLNSDVKVDSAIFQVIKYYPPQVEVSDCIDGSKKKKIPPDSFIEYFSVDEFKKINPNCCIFYL